MDKKNAIKSESVLNQSTVKVYIDGSKLNGRVGAVFMPNTQTTSQTSIFPSWNLQYCVQGRSHSYFRSDKEPAFEKMHHQSIVLVVDSQAPFKALLNCTVTSITVLNCIRNLNQLGKQNHVSIAWIPGHSEVHGNEVAK